MAFLNIFDEFQSKFKELTLPFLAIHGDADKLAHISGSKMLYEQSPSSDKTFTVRIIY